MPKRKAKQAEPESRGAAIVELFEEENRLIAEVNELREEKRRGPAELPVRRRQLSETRAKRLGEFGRICGALDQEGRVAFEGSYLDMINAAGRAKAAIASGDGAALKEAKAALDAAKRAVQGF